MLYLSVVYCLYAGRAASNRPEEDLIAVSHRVEVKGIRRSVYPTAQRENERGRAGQGSIR